MRSVPVRGAALLVAPLIFTCAACERSRQPSAATELEPPPPPAPVAGLAGFESRSRLEYFAAPDVLHLLEATYVFPARVRWSRSILAGGPAERVLSYRYGEHLFTVPDRASTSRELEGRERESLARSMELRRALFLWPDGHDWRGQGDLRRADLGPLGVLQARLDGEGRPSELASLDRDGLLLEGFTAITWQTRAGRAFPASMELAFRREPIWAETVERVVVDIGMIDDHFLPVDRRGQVPRSGVPPEPPMTVQATTLRSIALAADGDWDDLLAQARRVQDEERKRLARDGFEVAPDLVLELSSAGRPTHVQVRLLPFPGAPPPGFERRDDCSARARFLSHPSQIGPALAALGLRENGLAWVLVKSGERGAGATLQLVVPDPPGARY